MNNRQRLVLVLLLFAAASSVFLVLAVPPLATGYTLTPSYVFSAVSAGEHSNRSGEDRPSDVRGEYRSAVSDGAYPLRARLDTHVALFTAERHALLSIGDYAVLGDSIVATGGSDAAYEIPLVEVETHLSVGSGDSLLLNATGGPIAVIGAERIWSRGRRVLALADGGRRFADISSHVFGGREAGLEAAREGGLEGEREAGLEAAREGERDMPGEYSGDGGEVPRIQPRWRYADAPLVAAADVGGSTVVADALARVYVMDHSGMRIRAEQPLGTSIPSISALAGDGGGTNLYIIGGVGPTHLSRFRLDEENGLRSESSTELPKTLRTSPHIEATSDNVAVAYDNAVSVYNSDLDRTGRQILDGEILRIGFFSGGRLLYVRSSAPDNMETPTEERLNVYYADDLSPMYRLDFDFPLYSITASPGGLAVGSDHGILLYEEGVE